MAKEKRAVCPECLTDECGFAEIDVIVGLALFHPVVTKRGRVEIRWDGETEVDWDGQHAKRPVTFECLACGHRFRKFKKFKVVDADFDPNAAAFEGTAG